MKLFLATKNAGKVREFKAILADQPWARDISVSSAEDYPAIPEPEETGTTFAENARLKAAYYAQATGLVALADDSGLAVEALDGRPGVQSARYGKDEADRITRLLTEMKPFPTDDQRAAHFACAIAVAAPDGEILAESEGRLEGFIAHEPRGSHGFGYDPIFHVPQLDCRLAEAQPEQKNAISHRGQALQALLPELKLIITGQMGM